ncbi:response regulator transcription factor [Funiculus sociatus GB2-A5]|uniref:Response regulator transcription factor n=1 Tax=Funiculus sociatus GB2-A5 TaxID=2933946 RepID=A0ABV0JS78_9CYAN|nr:response regulator transcription factor [Trichocoleus sp. FACHB-6]
MSKGELGVIAVMVSASNSIVRAGLESIIHASQLLEIVGSSSSFAIQEKLVEELQPDVVLLEWSIPDDAAEEKILALGALSPALVILADNADDTWVESALQVGVQAILPLKATANEIVAAVVAAAAGLVVLHPDFLDSLLPRSESFTRRLPASPIQALTGREIEVLGMLALGMGNKSIAKRLSISEHTVKFHVSSIFQKLNASSRTEAVTLGVRLGLIML